MNLIIFLKIIKAIGFILIGIGLIIFSIHKILEYKNEK